jgi:hypothetical protein
LKVKNRVGGGGKQIFQISSYQWSWRKHKK